MCERTENFSKERRLTIYSLLGLAAASLLPEIVFAAENPIPPKYFSLPSEKSAAKDVALTVDDCGFEVPLSQISKVVEAEKVPLTIFPAGYVLKSEPIKKKLLELESLGCNFGNHSFSHQRWEQMTEEKIAEDILLGEKWLRETFSERSILPILRPPGGFYNSKVELALQIAGGTKATVLWSASSGSTGGFSKLEDGVLQSRMYVKDQITKGVGRKIVLLHANKIDAGNFEWLVKYLRNSGYNLVDLRCLVRANNTDAQVDNFQPWKRELRHGLF